jgi:hypothetical protein
MKIKCTACRWLGTTDDVDKVEHGPDVWSVCRRCNTPENFVVLCDEPGCERESTCGTPTPTIYRRTCHDHRPAALRGLDTLAKRLAAGTP